MAQQWHRDHAGDADSSAAKRAQPIEMARGGVVHPRLVGAPLGVAVVGAGHADERSGDSGNILQFAAAEYGRMAGEHLFGQAGARPRHTDDEYGKLGLDRRTG